MADATDVTAEAVNQIRAHLEAALRSIDELARTLEHANETPAAEADR
jgi:hypothetical protein